ncbi:hypothetical protein [Kitasatospora sp. NPDC018619]|uniref:hypothetical protein n=1 Tax=unclassified Kitasatospora TaxID=2633591 RepID=UPI0037B342F9
MEPQRVEPERTDPERTDRLRAVAGAHRVTESVLAKAKKHRARHGSHGGGGGPFVLAGAVLLCGLAAWVAVLCLRRRGRQGG